MSVGVPDTDLDDSEPSWRELSKQHSKDKMSLFTKTLSLKTNAVLCTDYGTEDAEVGVWVLGGVNFAQLFCASRREVVTLVSQGEYIKEDQYL